MALEQENERTPAVSDSSSRQNSDFSHDLAPNNDTAKEVRDAFKAINSSALSTANSALREMGLAQFGIHDHDGNNITSDKNGKGGAQAKSENGTQGKSESCAQAKPENGAHAKPESGSQAKPENGAQAKPESTPAKPENGAPAKPENDAQAKPESGSQAKPENGAQAKPESTPAKPENGAPAKPENDAQAKSENGAQGKSESNALSRDPKDSKPVADAGNGTAQEKVKPSEQNRTFKDKSGNDVTEFKNDPEQRVSETRTQNKGDQLKETEFKDRKDGLVNQKDFLNRNEKTFSDGTKETNYEWGDKRNPHPEISKTIESADGNFKHSEFKNAAGKTSELNEYKNRKDGLEKYVGNQDGSYERHYKDGTVKRGDSQGNQSTEKPKVAEQNQSQTHKDKSGNDVTEFKNDPEQRVRETITHNKGDQLKETEFKDRKDGLVNQKDFLNRNEKTFSDGTKETNYEWGDKRNPHPEISKTIESADGNFKHSEFKNAAGKTSELNEYKNRKDGLEKYVGNPDGSYERHYKDGTVKRGDSQVNQSTEKPKAAEQNQPQTQRDKSGNDVTEFKNDPEQRIRETRTYNKGDQLKETEFKDRKDGLVNQKDFLNRTEKTFADGAKETNYEWGDKRNPHPEISSTYESANGNFKRTEFKGTSGKTSELIEYKNRKDGLEKHVGNEDGSAERHYKDGTVKRIDPKGNVSIEHAKPSEQGQSQTGKEVKAVGNEVRTAGNEVRTAGNEANAAGKELRAAGNEANAAGKELRAAGNEANAAGKKDQPSSEAQGQSNAANPEKAVKELIQKLDDDKFSTREEASKQLKSLGRDAIPILKDGLAQMSEEQKMHSKDVIAHLNSPGELVKQLASNRDREAASAELLKQGHSALPELQQVLAREDANAQQREAALKIGKEIFQKMGLDTDDKLSRGTITEKDGTPVFSLQLDKNAQLKELTIHNLNNDGKDLTISKDANGKFFSNTRIGRLNQEISRVELSNSFGNINTRLIGSDNRPIVEFAVARRK